MSDSNEIRKQIGRRIRKARESLDLRQLDLAAMCGWPGNQGQTRISNYERGMRSSKNSDLLKICSALRLSPNEVLAGAAPSPDTTISRIPILEWIEIAGFLESRVIKYDWERRFVAYADTENANVSLFALEVFGPQMSPRFEPGDIVICRPETDPGPGAYVIARTANRYALRQIERDGSESFLIALDPKVSPVPVDDSHSVVAHVVQLIRNFSR